MSAANPSVEFESKNVDRTLVQSLARECGQPEPEVERVLREEIDRITAGARINTFVTVLATSSVRMRLRGNPSASR